jgi:hypothetical protein
MWFSSHPGSDLYQLLRGSRASQPVQLRELREAYCQDLMRLKVLPCDGEYGFKRARYMNLMFQFIYKELFLRVLCGSQSPVT